MSALIRVVASTESAQLQPGEWVALTLTVQNLGETVDRYQITVEGIPPSWAKISRTELSLFPKDQDQVRITLHTPAGTEARAGHHDARILVTSLENPDEQTSVFFALEVVALAALDLRLAPLVQSSPAGGSYTVRVGNRGNTDLTVFFEAVDTEGGCFYTFEPSQASVPAGQESTVHLGVNPVAPLEGKAPHAHLFTVTARPAEAPQQAYQVQGVWEQTPRKRLIWPILVAAPVAIVAIAAVVFFLVVWPNMQPSATEPVAMATPEETSIPSPMPTPKPTSPAAAEPTSPATAEPTLPATVEPTSVPTAVPTTAPTPDPRSEIEAALEDYTRVRADAEQTLKPELLRQVCVDPYLSIKMERIQRNIQDGTRWETWSVDWSITSLTMLGDDRAEVWVKKTETKVFFPKGSSVPDDELCQGTIYSYRNCTYDAKYILVRQEGRWYVSEAESVGDCESKCQK